MHRICRARQDYLKQAGYDNPLFLDVRVKQVARKFIYWQYLSKPARLDYKKTMEVKHV